MERPRSLTAAAVLVSLQGLAFLGYGIVELLRAIFGHPHDKGTAVLLGVTVIVLAAGIFVAAAGLLRMRRWAQAPTYIVQFFSIIIGMGQIATLPAMMVPLVIVGLATLVTVSLQPSRDALGGI
ncbi:MAG TPA: hypothetical protein VG899_09965 [Mycobacteriales bacterium]|nr:hypothetical protein [Mycobacteriales bacterium]HWA66678.1 hypothetical protein [Mycobacteriales bacterium]